MFDLVKAVRPDFPNDRDVKETMEVERFWKIVEKVLYVPSQRILKGNFIMLDKFIEAVNNFASLNLEQNRDWGQWPRKKEFLTERDECLTMINFTLQKQKEIAVDIETRRVEYKDNALLLIGFAWTDSEGNDRSCVIADFEEPVRQCLMRLLSNPNIKFIWHNGKFDTTRLRYLQRMWGVKVDEDTMLMHYVGINERKGTHGLKDLAPLYLQAPQWDDELQNYKQQWCRQHRVRVSDFTYDMIPKQILVPYLHLDALATLRLYRRFKELMRPDSWNIYRILVKASNVFREIELAGNYVDENYLYDLEDELDQNIVQAERDLRMALKDVWNEEKYIRDTDTKGVVGTFNYKSPKQLKWVLEQIAGRPLASADKNVLDEISEQFPDNKFVQAITALRKYNKYMDTYVVGIRDLMCIDKRIRCTYNLHGTETGRLSSSEPNMQNIPRNKAIKNIFVAPPGRKLIQLDYSQAELRVLAYLSQDEYLKETYREDKDLHSAMALKMFGPDFTKEDRVKAKTINFGIPYGRGPGSIAQNMKISYGEAVKLVRDWYAAAPQVKQFVDKMRALPQSAEADNYRTVFGRKRSFIITNDNLNGIQNESINFPIQSTASDCTLISIIKIYEYLKEENIDAFICNTVHDSIIIECVDDPDVIKEISDMAQRIMSDVPKEYLPGLDFPFKADVSVGIKWGELE